MANNTILRLPDVMLHTGLSRSTIYARVKDGQLAPPINLGGRAVGWLTSDVDAYITSLIHASRKSVEVQ